MISILIADDHPMVREGLEAMLESEEGFKVVALASDGFDAVRLYSVNRPDIVLSDIRMPGLDGFGMLADIRGEYPNAKVLLLAGMPLKEEERRAREGGARGYLPKNVDQDRLTEAIRKIAADDGCFVCEEFQSAPSPLTVRELDVLRHLAKGLQRDQIAEQLGIGPESVKTHMKGLMNKLDCPNAAAAVAKAFESGILRV